jgi:hypothetical protein
MSADPAVELCKRYAIESQVASVSQSILQRVPCEFACKTVSPVYDSSFVCIEPGEYGRLACTLMSVEDLAKEEDGACDNCKKHRIPALKSLQDAKKRMATTRKEIIREGMRWVVAERLQGIS